MGVSLEAIFLSTFVLISQNRAGQETEPGGDVEMETRPEDLLAEIDRLHRRELDGAQWGGGQAGGRGARGL